MFARPRTFAPFSVPLECIRNLSKAPSKYTRRYDNTGMTNPQKIFAGMVTALDEAIGQVVDGLKESGLWDNTLIFFSNDNGREGAEQHRGGMN